MKFNELAKFILNNKEAYIIDKEEVMEKTLEIHATQQVAIKTALHAAKEEKRTREQLEQDNAQAVHDFYNRGNKVD